MSLPYQPRFLYRRRRNSPIPSPYGEYITPRSGFDGFGGPSYTLGSLSNRPGSDWATPRYVRDEPDMFMAGFGQVPEGATDNGDGTYRNDDGTTGYIDADTDVIEDPYKDDTGAREGDAPDIGPTTMELIESYGKDVADAVNKALPTINALVNTGLSFAAAVEKTTGIKIPGLPTSPPKYVPAPPPPSAQPIYATPAQQAVALLQNVEMYPLTIKPGTRYAIQVVQPKSPTTMYLILGAVAVGAFLLLKKK